MILPVIEFDLDAADPEPGFPGRVDGMDDVGLLDPARLGGT